ncbi:Vacuolar protein sorting-associated, VPS28 [Carpediemonas membranifera]|uniref:Vacuolar protein sorting-associated, VPS28 n=1 Tax=Carpediemonas membranifera TaxID=201153 RepID=A0A8J6E075_9EUKA|nr:Vacuolar protein sorting-associated, VPS28 [Carpediemonas membranifera]QNO39394.1 vacuolar protein sorting 28 [Carpediemonas membranifera]|eukprot:KAG9394674.1 Vacuolar protein sorting-associated, VPS28 [Carpediemonas membranifera]
MEPRELTEEVKLTKTTMDEKNYDLLANMFACMKCIDYLERIYASGDIKEDQYVMQCKQLLNQFFQLKQSVKDIAPDHERFAGDFSLQCPSALARIREGVPATSQNGVSLSGPSQIIAANKVTEKFITLMDQLHMNYRTKQDLAIGVESTYEAMIDLALLPVDFSGKVEFQKWINTFNMMRATDSLSEEQAGELLFACEHTYQKIKDLLQSS